MQVILTFVLAGAAWAAFSISLVWIPAWWLWNTFVTPVFDLPALTLFESTGCLNFFWIAKYASIDDNTLADAILDRLMHNAHRLQLNGGSMRKKHAELTHSEYLS